MIVTMKKVSLLGLLSQQQQIMAALQKFGRVQFIGEAADSGKTGQLQLTREKAAEIARCIQFLESFRVETRSLLASLNVTSRAVSEADAAALLADGGRLDRAVEAVHGYESELAGIKTEITRLEAQKALLDPWTGLSVKIEDMADTRLTRVVPGFVLTRDAAAFFAEADDTDGIAVSEAGTTTENACFLLAAHRGCLAELDRLTKQYNFIRIDFGGLTGTPRQAMETTRTRLADCEKRLGELSDRLGHSELLEYFENMCDLTGIRAQLLAATALSSDTACCFVAEGWVPAEDCDKLQKTLESVSDSFVVEFFDPTEDEEPPTLVRSNPAVRPFESIVDAFSHPNYRDVDPNTLVAIFYSIFFGMMVGDAGYGLILVVACGAVLFFMKPKPSTRRFLGVFFAGGLAAVAVGVIMGSYFGAAIFPALLPITSESGMPLQLEIPLQMMGVSIGLGVLHLFSGYCAKAYKNIRDGKIFAAIFDQGFWMLFITGLLLLAAPILFEGSLGQTLSTVGKYMALICAAGLVLTQGRDKKGIIGKIGGGLGSLYNVSGFLGDALSYTRLFALGLSSGIIAWVFNMMSQLLGTDSVVGVIYMVIILLIGHSINFALSLLSAYVHTSRLQYVEFLGKFYEGNGEEYLPLSAGDTAYITVVPGTAPVDNIQK